MVIRKKKTHTKKLIAAAFALGVAATAGYGWLELHDSLILSRNQATQLYNFIQASQEALAECHEAHT